MKTNSVHFFNETNPRPVCSNCELILAAWKVRNPSNLGHIIRLGHNAGAKKVLFAGNRENYRQSKIKKTAGFSYDRQDWQIVPPENFLSEQIMNNCELVMLETCEGSVNIFESDLPAKALILAGNESHGLPREIILQNSLKVHIPMPGACKSMNISHALSVAAFEWYRQHAV